MSKRLSQSAMWVICLMVLGSSLTAADAPVGKTGASVSYAVGDDGDLQPGEPQASPRFTDNLNGTITDNSTGLVWMKNPSDFGGRKWADGLTAVAALESGMSGLSDGSQAGDWRMPNVNEMMSLVDVSQYDPALPVGHPFEGSISAFWTSTTRKNYSGTEGTEAFRFLMWGGNITSSAKTGSTAIWPVRDARAAVTPAVEVAATGAGPLAGYTLKTGEDGQTQHGVAWPSPRFTNNGDGTVTDNLTGLIWLRKANAFTNKTWDQAVSSANGLRSGQQGLSDGSAAGDWRLPTYREMQSLMSYGVSAPSLPAGNPFTGTSITEYWTSSTFVGSRRYESDGSITLKNGISVHTFFGFTSVTNDKGVTLNAWPVRGGTLGAPPPAAPEFLKQPLPKIAYVGDRVIFTTEVLVNSGSLTYEWSHNGNPVGGNSARLELNPVTSLLAGTYVVTVIGDGGTIVSEPVVMRVADAPPENGRLSPVVKPSDWPSPRFVDNADGTVTDMLTGLRWLQNANISEEITWKEALAWASDLENGKAGLSDGSLRGQWRLPSITELNSVCDYRRTRPSLPRNHPFTLDWESSFWSSTISVDSTQDVFLFTSAKTLDMQGLLGASTDDTKNFAWAVRYDEAVIGAAPAPVARSGAQDIDDYDEDPREDATSLRGTPWPVPRFTDMGDGTVRDNLTNLIWMKNADPFSAKFTRTNARNAVADIASGDFGLSDGSQAGDWRIPSAMEMTSLFHFGLGDDHNLPDTLGTGAWSEGDPFIHVQRTTGNYHLSDLRSGANVKTANPGVLGIGTASSSFEFLVWPVRDATGPSNEPPQIDTPTLSGTTLAPSESLQISVTGSDDGLPANPGAISWLWSVEVGDANAVSFADETAADTTATFSAEGIYVLRATASDGELQSSVTTTEITVTTETSPGTIDIALPTEITVAEGDSVASTVTLTLRRRGGQDGAVSVSYNSNDDTATAGEDYVAVSGSISWADGDSADKTLELTINGDTDFESLEHFVLTLASPSGGATLGQERQATITISNDDEAPGAGVLTLVDTQYAVIEGNSGTTEVTVSIARNGSASGSVTVDYATEDGTATAGGDYVSTSGTLTWGGGDDGIKSFTVTVNGDTANEANETITLRLSNPSGGAAMGNGLGSLTITNDDAVEGAGIIAIESAAVTVTEGDSGSQEVLLQLSRSGGSAGEVSVQFETLDGTATAGDDFSTATGLVTWPDGDSDAKTITISILGDTLLEADESFTVAIDDPTGGATLANTTTTITIEDQDIVAIIGRIVTILGINGRGWEPRETISADQDANGDTNVGPYSEDQDVTLDPIGPGGNG